MYKLLIGVVVSLTSLSTIAQAAETRDCAGLLVDRDAVPNPYVQGYEATRVLGLEPTRELADFRPATGLSVTARDAAGEPAEVLVRVLSDNPGNSIQVVGEFNGWGTRLRPEDQLKLVPGTPYAEARITGLKHGMQYRLVVNGKQLLDPAAEMFTPDSYLNSVFWDFGRPGAYRLRTKSVDLRNTHIVLGETEIRALIQDWPNPRGGFGPETQSDTYRFIATSGVIEKLKAMGYNAIEFLPFNMSNDGAEWHFRYQVYGLFAPDSRFGTPDDFARMMDAFNQAGLGVVMDVVVGHYPYDGNLSSGRDLTQIGLHQWKKADGRNLYGEELSPWGTYRYDYANPYIRRHLIDSILTMVRRYGISGLRFDNLDGIRFAQGGRDFLRDLMTEIRAYRPELWTNAEMFFGDNSVTAAMDQGGLGLNARTNSDLFDWFKEHAQGPTEGFDMGELRARLRNPLVFWHEGARTDYITSHDESANGRGGFTGQYPASLLGPSNDWWVGRKTEVFEGLVLTAGSATMDMPQVRFLQRGTFSGQPGIDWSLLGNESSSATSRFIADLSRYVTSNKAFNFMNMTAMIENHTDYTNHVVSLLRTDGTKKIYVVINLSHQGFSNYVFGVDTGGGKSLRLVLNNDSRAYGGTGWLEQGAPGGSIGVRPSGEHGKPQSVMLPYLAPMSVVVLETDSGRQ